MNTFLQLPAERRRLAFQQVDESMGLQAFSVEKDFWVCWTLRELLHPALHRRTPYLQRRHLAI